MKTKEETKENDVILPGMVAICSMGFPGLILSDKPEEIKYPDGNKGVAWTGIHLSQSKFGQPWSSRNPKIIGFIWDAPLVEEKHIN
jgi:hypothetical protein